MLLFLSGLTGVYYVWPATLQNNCNFWVFRAKRAFTLTLHERMEDDYEGKTVHFQMRGCSFLVQFLRVVSESFGGPLVPCLHSRSGRQARAGLYVASPSAHIPPTSGFSLLSLAEVFHMHFRFSKVIIVSSLLFVVSSSFAQYGNEWINYNQSYYKIPITKTGIFRLTYDDLSTAGLPVNTIDPRNIQIFRRGAEQSINFHYLEAPADDQFESGEYLEFFGEKNDGATDVDLYKNPAHHPHPFYNLYSDTAAYFLTWSIATPGKRMAVLDPEPNDNNLPAETGFNSTILTVLNNVYSAGLTSDGQIQNSFFDEGEGWTGPLICTQTANCASTQDYVVSAPGGVISLSPPQLEVLLVGRVERNHQVEVYVGPNASSLRLIASPTFINFQNFKVSSALQWTDVAGDGTVTVRLKAIGVSGALERFSVSYLKLDYLRSFNLAGLNSQIAFLQPNAGNKSYIEIQNPAASIRLFDITDLTSVSIIGTYASGANLAAVVSNTISSRKIFATNEVFTPTLKKISFRSLTPIAQSYLIISNAALRQAALGYDDPVKAYAAFRASPEGGSYDTMVVNIDQLYNQFNYGETSSRAVYQFLKYMASGTTLKYVFIIGKGVEINTLYDRRRTPLVTDAKDLVPTAGFPGSDLIYSSALSNNGYTPAIPTGRITATSATDVAAYLNKVKETEALPFDNLWRKNILHLSGGINAGEPQTFREYVDGFKTIAEDIFLGGHVDTKSKLTLDAGELVPIADHVNSGLGLITFFGHSSTSTLDFDIGKVTDPVLGYNNPGKYPAFVINGCNVGKFFLNSQNKLFGEDWILAQNKGAKAFIAHSSFAPEVLLWFYSHAFYENAVADSVMLTKGMGDIQVSVANTIWDFAGPSTNYLAVSQQMVLLGDPAVTLFGASKPDYEIKDDFLSKISFDGKPITAATDSFGIKYKIRNYGQARKDSLRIKLTRTFPNNTQVTYDTIVPSVYYENEYIFIVPNPSNQGGSNSFLIEVDSDHDRVELNEANNMASINFFIPGSSTYNLVPFHYSIVNTTEVELIFQNTNQLPIVRDYLLELDTVPSFNSSFLIQEQISANVLGRFKVNIPNKNSTVYYWRTKLAQPAQSESDEWFTTSFSFWSNINEGWAQKPGQFFENELTSLIQSEDGSLQYPEIVSTVFVHNYGSANGAPSTATSIKVNNEELNLATQGQPCRTNTFNLVAFDKISGNTYAAIPLTFQDPKTCGREPQVINSFTLAEAGAASNGLTQAITNIAANDSVVFFTIGNSGIQSYSLALLTKLEEVGISSAQLAGFQLGEPMIVFGKKGTAPGAAKVIRPTIAPVNAQELIANETITARSGTGTMESGAIGPAKVWNSLTNTIKNIEGADVFLLEIIGISSSNIESVLYSGTADFVNLSAIDPVLWPRIKLRLATTDDTNLTPVSLENWIVRYTPVAEGILLFRGPSESVMHQEGQPWSGKYAFINLTDKDFLFNGTGETLNVELKQLNIESSESQTQSIEIDAPAPKDSTVFIWDIETVGWIGLNDLSVTANNNLIREQYYFNDQMPLDSYLSINPDQQPPILDVTVDGRYLVNGDVVSHHPQVNIKIIDENPFWFKSDTLGIQIFINDQVNQTSRRINFSDPNLTWTAASVEGDFNISFHVELIAGEYELTVYGVDASNNRSGETPYAVLFYVTDQLSVVLGDPFPNPSMSSFSFPIKLTGNELPESFSMKVFSPDGQLKQAFDLEDVSNFFIGTNYLEWMPDLPNGVYFFQAELSLTGKSFSKSGRLILLK
jgi:hypothetical protein